MVQIGTLRKHVHAHFTSMLALKPDPINENSTVGVMNFANFVSGFKCGEI